MKRRFTLIEILFAIAILVILIGISMIAGNKILRKTAEAQTKAEIKLLSSAIESYRSRWGQYPVSANNTVDFIEWLSKISPHALDENNQSFPRPMFLDCLKSDMNISNRNYFYSQVFGVSVSDPYEQIYIYRVQDNKFSIVPLDRDWET